MKKYKKYIEFILLNLLLDFIFFSEDFAIQSDLFEKPVCEYSETEQCIELLIWGVLENC